MPPLPIGDEPGPFAFAEPAHVQRILLAAGFEAVALHPYDVVLEPPDEPDAVAEWLIEVGARSPVRIPSPLGNLTGERYRPGGCRGSRVGRGRD